MLVIARSDSEIDCYSYLPSSAVIVREQMFKFESIVDLSVILLGTLFLQNQ